MIQFVLHESWRLKDLRSRREKTYANKKMARSGNGNVYKIQRILDVKYRSDTGIDL